MRLVTTHLGTKSLASPLIQMRLITMQDNKQASFDTIPGYLN